MTFDDAALKSAAAAAYEVSRGRLSRSHLLRDLNAVPPPWEDASAAMRAPWQVAARAAVDAYAAHLALYGAAS
ncbi:hypothetical protein [Actinomycetospora termitidis]|uniref:Uncharacterized protein n=1 Tax=Actinomycetospora termitidis TaxID=3053470 RepID=A0ABT7MFH7_9PSEU|nr:hypothetical protein [Actinomycetospora sp. Odt1-22]MDL5159426.1 hypothetical protein [Actinomycetospora sp. Odt1-22]